MLKWLGPRLWISTIMVVWGVILAAMAAVRDGKDLMAARFFLGVAEVRYLPYSGDFSLIYICFLQLFRLVFIL